MIAFQRIRPDRSGAEIVKIVYGDKPDVLTVHGKSKCSAALKHYLGRKCGGETKCPLCALQIQIANKAISRTDT
jgi:hypothetical protein